LFVCQSAKSPEKSLVYSVPALYTIAPVALPLKLVEFPKQMDVFEPAVTEVGFEFAAIFIVVFELHPLAFE
jgi:hypothetical protein